MLEFVKRPPNEIILSKQNHCMGCIWQSKDKLWCLDLNSNHGTLTGDEYHQIADKLNELNSKDKHDEI